ncbi:ferri-bacillibactin esterase [Rhypophila decipiens]
MSLGDWTFNAFPPFPATVYPNSALWNVTSEAKNRTYQVQVSWPFSWESRDVSNKSALTLYVLDGNAMGTTAHEAVHRRAPLSFGQPDTIVVSIGYPLTNNIYDFIYRFQDYSPPIPTPRIPEAHGDEFLAFINTSLRPWLQSTAFPNVDFTRDGLYGHSFGGLFALYALTVDGGRMFDTYISASPAVEWRNGTILEMLTDSLGNGSSAVATPGIGVRDTRSSNWGGCTSPGSDGTYTDPALFITYGSLEQFPVKRRTETQEQFLVRKNYFGLLKMTDYVHEVYDVASASGKLRDVTLKEYPGQDHSGVAGTSIMDGIDYFVDW